MICLFTRIGSDRSAFSPRREAGHMAWRDADEAYRYAVAIYGQRYSREHPGRSRNQFSIELSRCEHPETCPVQEGIALGLYDAVPPIEDTSR